MKILSAAGLIFLQLSCAGADDAEPTGSSAPTVNGSEESVTAVEAEKAGAEADDLNLTNGEVTLIVGGVKCATGLYGLPASCEALASSTVSGTIVGVAKGCADKAIEAKKKEQSAENVRDQCIEDAVKAALNAAYMNQLGVCLPVVGAVQACVSTFTNALGYGFNSLWCSTYPNDCYSDAKMQEIINKKYIAASEFVARKKKGDRLEKAEMCFEKCMQGTGYVADRECNSMLGASSKAICQKWVATCSKCDNNY